MKTRFLKKEEVGTKEHPQNWFLVDAKGKTLGRIATQIADILRGKNKVSYTPHVDNGDFVVVVNAEKIALSGKKLTDKIYYHHTGYPGGIKQATAAELLEKHPERVIMKAVKGMMPKNALNRASFNKLKVYAGGEHPHSAQNPQPLSL